MEPGPAAEELCLRSLQAAHFPAGRWDVLPVLGQGPSPGRLSPGLASLLLPTPAVRFPYELCQSPGTPGCWWSLLGLMRCCTELWYNT